MIRNNFALRTLFGGILILSLGSSALISPSKAEADVIGNTECFPAVLMLKGSGEGTTDGTIDGPPVDIHNYVPVNSSTGQPYITTNGHEGVILGRLLQEFVDKTDPDKTVSKVRFIGVETPSLPVFPEVPKISDNPLMAGAYAIDSANIWMNHIIKYNQSYRTGAQMVLDTIDSDMQRGCDTQYMLLSYSQGVISARLAMNFMGNNTDKIISSYVMGDPFQAPNGPNSTLQYTDANTSRDTAGVGRAAVDMLIKIGKSGGFLTQGLVDGLTNYKNEMVGADPLIYRLDTSESGGVSRSLCHKSDPTCSISELSMDALSKLSIDEHMNYFNSDTEAGSVDSELEVSEFDQQVQKLAQSKKAINPRQRKLTKSPSLAGEITSYNIANARPDDKCTWDDDSDGVPEYIDVSCSLHNVIHSGNVGKVSVTVKDSFGTSHPFVSEVKTMSPEVANEIVDTVSALDTKSWYEFTPYYKGVRYPFENESCLTWQQSHDTFIDPNNSFLKSLRCNNQMLPTSLDLSTQEFRTILYPTSEGNQVRMVSGYDDNYAWEANDSTDEVKIAPISSSSRQNFVPILSEVKDKPYYMFKLGDKCITGDWDNIYLRTCNSNNIYQLFSARPTSWYSTGRYGSLSMERDTTAPSSVTGLKIEVDSDKVNLVWNPSKDTRSKTVNYQIYKFNYIAGVPESSIIPEYFTNTGSDNFLPLDLSGATIYQRHGYCVYAIDYSGNRSGGGCFKFGTPPLITKPTLPAVTISSDKTLVTVIFPGTTSTPSYINGIEVYVDGVYVTTVPRGNRPTEIARYFDRNISPYVTSKKYSYKYQIGGPQVTSIMSDLAVLNIR